MKDKSASTKHWNEMKWGATLTHMRSILWSGNEHEERIGCLQSKKKRLSSPHSSLLSCALGKVIKCFQWMETTKQRGWCTFNCQSCCHLVPQPQCQSPSPGTPTPKYNCLQHTAIGKCCHALARCQWEMMCDSKHRDSALASLWFSLIKSWEHVLRRHHQWQNAPFQCIISPFEYSS